jgi:hypothetical protein
MSEREAARAGSRERRRRVDQRRRRAALGVVCAAATALVAGAVTGAGGTDETASPPEAATAELPGGGTELLPRYRMVGFYGAPQADELGALGIGSPAKASRRLAKQARAYESTGKPVMPFMELIATIANADPGGDGLYRSRQTRRTIDEYLDQARAAGQILVLDIQPGAADFKDEVDRLRPWLRQPDVGLGLDPEWHVGEGQVPGQVIGSVDAAEVNAITRGLSRTIERNNLPQKVLIVHRFTEDMIADVGTLKTYPGVATVLNVDGFGDAANKVQKYKDLHPKASTGLFSGFKLFYSEDTGLISPRDVLRLKPRPDLVVYE